MFFCFFLVYFFNGISESLRRFALKQKNQKLPPSFYIFICSFASCVYFFNGISESPSSICLETKEPKVQDLESFAKNDQKFPNPFRNSLRSNKKRLTKLRLVRKLLTVFLTQMFPRSFGGRESVGMVCYFLLNL